LDRLILPIGPKDPLEVEPQSLVLDIIYTNVYFMLFTWDMVKSETNRQERGFDFEFATLVFEGPTLQEEDRRREYGEQRIVAVGVADGLHLTVVFTDRPDLGGGLVRRIISP
jgi:uncharacterized DUF497 family protein